MPETVSAAVAGGAVKVAKWAWDHQDEVESRPAKLYRTTRRTLLGKTPSVLAVGPGGVAKTTLGRILSGKYDFLFDSSADYEQSVGVQTFRERKSPDVEVVVAPGQEDRRQSTWPELLAGLSAGRIGGVVLCCAYGYHSLRISHKYHKLYKADGSAAFLGRYLPDRRADELKILSEVTSAVARAPKPVWLLTFVGKEDLWSPDEAKVRDFYTAGEYGSKISAVATSRGAASSGTSSSSGRWSFATSSRLGAKRWPLTSPGMITPDTFNRCGRCLRPSRHCKRGKESDYAGVDQCPIVRPRPRGVAQRLRRQARILARRGAYPLVRLGFTGIGKPQVGRVARSVQIAGDASAQRDANGFRTCGARRRWRLGNPRTTSTARRCGEPSEDGRLGTQPLTRSIGSADIWLALADAHPSVCSLSVERSMFEADATARSIL